MKLRWKIAQAAEIRWWQSYLKGKSSSEYLTWKKNYWQAFLQKINVSPKPLDSILDVGCGPAGVFINLDQNEVTAVDPLLEQYGSKLEHFSQANYPWVRFISLPYEQFTEKKQFDLLFCLNAINHVSDLELCFDRLVAHTQAGGTLVISIDAHNHSFFKHLFRLLPGDILHPHQYDLQEYQDMLISRNCELVSTTLIKSEFFFDYYALVLQKKE